MLAIQTSSHNLRAEECEALPHSFSVEATDFARLAGSSRCPVLLYGETGSGKTQLARLIHQYSSRVRMPFVRVNCGAIPEGLFEREMFGHVRGAFTDARDSAGGFFEAASGGTLFLDEIGELPLQVQPKLLAALEDGLVRRLGSPREIKVDVQIVAATNRDLVQMVRQRQFREDLYYRFSVLQYRVAPLRERPEELLGLVEALLRKYAGRGEAPRITDGALQALRGYAWPGNVRELENVLRAGTVFAQGAPIEVRHLPRHVLEAFAAPTGDVGSRGRAAERYEAPRDPRHERQIIRRALDEAGGNKTLAARALGMSRSTLWARIRQYGAELANDAGGAPDASRGDDQTESEQCSNTSSSAGEPMWA
jgi:DNA-binding NtrC family response regulator